MGEIRVALTNLLYLTSCQVTLMPRYLEL